MRTKIVLTAIVFFTGGQALAADSSDQQSAADQQQDDQAPTQPAPSQAPPPPGDLPPPPAQPEQAQPGPEAQAAPGNPVDGQWTYTEQYGWVFTPYTQNYTYVQPDGELAFTYAFYPGYGWRWLPAPWVLGFGPRPYFGPLGFGRFAWYAHPWFHRGAYRANVWTRWGHGYGRGYVYHRTYERSVARPAFGHGGGAHYHGGGHHR